MLLPPPTSPSDVAIALSSAVCIAAALDHLEADQPLEALATLELLPSSLRTRADALAVQVGAFLALGHLDEARRLAEIAVHSFHLESCTLHASPEACPPSPSADIVRGLADTCHSLSHLLALIAASSSPPSQRDIGLSS